MATAIVILNAKTFDAKTLPPTGMDSAVALAAGGEDSAFERRYQTQLA